jgi:hypothetical protein
MPDPKIAALCRRCWTAKDDAELIEIAIAIVDYDGRWGSIGHDQFRIGPHGDADRR